MQYLLLDAHQRFLGTLNTLNTLAIGDTFENSNAQTYAVVGMNWSQQRNRQTPSLTVIPVNTNAKKPE